MSDFTVTGGCQCGAVRYTITDPARETAHCWCGMCRKIHGAIMVTFSTVARNSFTVDKGADNLGRIDSSPPIHRRFCKSCGCHLFIEMDDAPDLLEVATGTLDGGAHPGHAPDRLSHVWTGSKVSWLEIPDDGLARHEKEGPGG